MKASLAMKALLAMKASMALLTLIRFGGVWVCLAGVSICLAGAPGMLAAASGDPEFDRIQKLASIDPKIDAELPLDVDFVDESGKSVKLKDFIAGERPALLAIVYYKCPKLCNEVMRGLAVAVKTLNWTPGKEFEIVVVSMDPRDKPEVSAEREKGYLEMSGRPGTEAGWHFLTGQAPEIGKLCEKVGFGYVWQEDRQEFAHGGGLFLISPAGRLSSFLPGIVFPEDELRVGLLKAGEGKLGTVLERFNMLCISWDPRTGRYTNTAFTLMRVGGVLTLAGIAALMFFLVRGKQRTLPPKSPEGGKP